jgi:hypothetical protein
MAKRQIQPGFVLAVCIAQALQKRDPKFLAVLKETVDEVQKTQPQGETTWDTLQIFRAGLNDPELFTQP